MRQPSKPVRVVASVLAFALVHASFGTQAWAQVISVGAVSAPVGGAAAAAGSNASAISFPNGPVVNLPVTGLNGSFAAPSLAPAPALTPSISLSATPSAPLIPASAAAAESARVNATPAALAGHAAVSVAAAKSDDAKPALTPAAVPASAGDSVRVESGAKTRSVASRATAIINGVKRMFGGRNAETVPDATATGAYEPVAAPLGLEASSTHLSAPMTPDDGKPAEAVKPQSQNEPPAPPQKPDQPNGKGKWLGLGAIAMGLIGGMLVMQLGLEAQGAAMAQLTEDAFGDFSILAQVAIFASIGSMVGQQLAKFFSDRFGLTKTFYGAHVLRAVSLATMIVLLGTGHMALPLMFVFYALNGMVTGIAATAQGTLQKFILAQNGVSQQKFRTWWQLLAETIAVPAPMLLGALVATLGASWITAIYPATIVLGLMLFLMLKVIPLSAAKRIENQVGGPATATAPAADPNAPKVGAWQKIKNAFVKIFNNMEEGKEFVFKNPVLKYSLIGATIFDLMNVLIYRLITPGYGKLVAGSAGMAAVQGNLVGMFSLGGLLLAATFLILERRDKKKNEGRSADELAAAERSSMLRWTLFGIPALALLGVMAFNLVLPFAPVMLFGVNWVPSTVLGAVLIPFGFMQVAASIKLNSYFQERLPSDSGKVQKAIAFSGSAMTALSIVLMLALKPLFGDIAAFNPFPYLAAALIPVGAALFFIQRKLANATKPENLHLTAGEDKAAGGFVGVLMGVISAALLLSFVTFIPGVGPLVAGLGLLGKFLLNLGVALALPVAGWFADRAIRKRAK